MRKFLVMGIGTGDPDQVTVQAVRALRPGVGTAGSGTATCCAGDRRDRDGASDAADEQGQQDEDDGDQDRGGQEAGRDQAPAVLAGQAVREPDARPALTPRDERVGAVHDYRGDAALVGGVAPVIRRERCIRHQASVTGRRPGVKPWKGLAEWPSDWSGGRGS